MKLTGILALLVAIAYIAIPIDIDKTWYGYTDDFFVFMAAYLYFMASRNKSIRIRRQLMLLSGFFFIIGMCALIVLILFS